MKKKITAFAVVIVLLFSLISLSFCTCDKVPHNCTGILCTTCNCIHKTASAGEKFSFAGPSALIFAVAFMFSLLAVAQWNLFCPVNFWLTSKMKLII